MRVRILVNGPGELWGWARPLCREMSGRGWEVSIHILNCPFASGMEAQAASRIPGVVEVVGPLKPWRTLTSLGRYDTDLVVQLGGDLLFGLAMAARHSVPLACYSYGRKKGLNRCDFVATAFPAMASLMPPETVVIGDLVVDGLSMDTGEPSPWKETPGKRLLFFPGSRPLIREAARDFIEKTVRSLRYREGLQIAALLSPFSDPEEVNIWGGSGVSPFTSGTESALSGADLAVTQPGTNTLELMHRAVPALVAVPFAFLSSIPLTGLKGIILSTPGGALLKEKILRRAAARRGYLAWPNRIAGKEIFPEFVGDLTPADLAAEIDSVMDDDERLAGIRNDLKSLTEVGSPSVEFCDALERLV